MIRSDPHVQADLLKKVSELNKRVRDLELRDFPLRSDVPSLVPPSTPGFTPYAVKAQHYGTFDVAAGTEIAVFYSVTLFNTTGSVSFAPSGMWDGASGLTAPADGLYAVCANWQFQQVYGHTIDCYCYWEKGGGGGGLIFADVTVTSVDPTAVGRNVPVNFPGTVTLSAGDSVELRISNEAADTLTVAGGSGGTEQVISGGLVSSLWRVG